MIDRENRQHQLSAICLESVILHLIKYGNPAPQTLKEFAQYALKIDDLSCGPFARTFLLVCDGQGIKSVQFHSFGTHFAVYDPETEICLDAANPFGYKKDQVFAKMHITCSTGSDFDIQVDRLEMSIKGAAKDNRLISGWLKSNFGL